MASETVFYNNKRLVGIGSVGIGTTSPYSYLSVTSGNSQFPIGVQVLESTHATSRRCIYQLGDPNSGWQIGQDTGGNGTRDFFIWGGSPLTFRFCILPSGNVGIGTANPGNTLDVSGTIGRVTTPANSQSAAFAVGGTMTSTNFNYIMSGANDTGTKLVIFINGSGRSADGGTSNVTIRNDGGSLILGQSSSPTIIYGNVGIGTASPNGKMHIYEATGTAAGPNAGTLVLDHGNNQGSSSICFPSRINNGSDYGYIQYNDSRGGTGETATLIIGTSNDSDDHVALMPAGYVGIGTMSPQTTLDVNGSMNALNYAQSTFTNQSGITITQTSASGTAMSGSVAGPWTSYAYSNQGFKYGAFCSARSGETNTYKMIGLATSQVNGNPYSFNNLNYAWHFAAASDLSIYESGANLGSFGKYTTLTVVSITFDGTNIIYWKDGVSQRTVARAVGAPLYLGYATQQGGSINAVQFDAFGSTTYAGRNIVGTTGSFSGAVVISNPDSATNDPQVSHLYCYNPTNSTGQCSIIAARIGGSSSANTYYSLDVAGSYGFSMGMSGASSRLQFRNAWNFIGTEVMTILNTGNVGIGTSAPGYGLEVVGSFRTSTTMTFSGGAGGGVRYVQVDNNGSVSYLASDARLKTNITPISYGLEATLKLNPVTFNWKDSNVGGNYTDLGFIAQEVEPIIPEVVRIDSNGTYSLNLPNINAVLTKAIQELAAKNTDLEGVVNSHAATIGSLNTQLQTAQNDIDLLESRLAAIEALISTNTSADTTTSSTGTRSDALLAAAGAV